MPNYRRAEFSGMRPRRNASIAAVRKAGAMNRTLLQAFTCLRVLHEKFTGIRNPSSSSRRRPGPSLESFKSWIPACAGRTNPQGGLEPARGSPAAV
jgi:hypothetical protein